MSQLTALRAASSLKDVAYLLETTASGLAYVLYKTPEVSKYTEFDIPKRYGGTRRIAAPVEGLRLLQRRLSNLLQNCLHEIEQEGGRKHSVSHGFKRGRSIMSNAEGHRRKRYVFNVDLKDFFPSIHFGRIRGFLISDKNFSLDPRVATFLAQIACYKGALPQGSPCSPVLSNLIGHVLDTHLVRLAWKEGCRYSRYADDLTFSTNKSDFPPSIATRSPDTNKWQAGSALVKLITKSGFAINLQKTRMQYRDSRQDVTGLVVNRKVNVSIDYRRMVRALTHHLLTEGKFSFMRSVIGADGTKEVTMTSGTTAQLHGMLAYIDQIDLYNFCQSEKGLDEIAEAVEQNKLSKKESIYRRFLLFTQFYAASRPVVVCEGATDNVYLVHAVRSLVAQLPILATKLPNGDIGIHVRFYRYFKRRKKKSTSEYESNISSTSRILQLRGGNGELLNFAKQYEHNVRKFKAPGAFQPVILLVDNDAGSNDIFAYLKNAKKILDPRKQPFIHFVRNLYVVPIPLTQEKPLETAIEDLFLDDTKNMLVNGLPFKPKKQHQDHTGYGKAIFAHKVVRPNAETIDFSGFKQLLLNISAVIEEHAKTHPAPGKLP